MLLVIDVGNTNTVLGVYDGDVLVDHWRIANRKGEDGRRMGNPLPGPFPVRQDQHAGFHRASSSPASFLRVEHAGGHGREVFSCDPLVVGPDIDIGMPILYDNPAEVGADRVVNAVAAYER